MPPDRSLTFIDLCHEYGASNATSVVTAPTLLRLALGDAKLEGSPAKSFSKYEGSEIGRTSLHQRLNTFEKHEGRASREALVNWFLFYGILQVAMDAGVVEPRLPERFTQEALKELKEPYDGFWTECELPLLEEFLRRLLGYGTRLPTSGTIAERLFDRFLSFDATIRSDPCIPWLFTTHEIPFLEISDDISRILSSPRRFVAALTQPHDQLRPAESLVLGTSRMIVLMRELFELLYDAQDNGLEILADSMRSYYRYWTDLLQSSSGMRTMSQLLSSYENWAMQTDDTEALREIRDLHRIVQIYPQTREPVPDPVPDPVPAGRS